MISRKSLILICIIGLAWVLLVLITQRLGYNVIICPSRLFYDLPCAGCGGTRAFILLVKGHPVDAFLVHPNVYLVVPFFLAGVVLAVYDLFHHSDKLNNCYTRFKKWSNRPVVYVPLLVFEVVIWGYNIWRYKHGML